MTHKLARWLISCTVKCLPLVAEESASAGRSLTVMSFNVLEGGGDSRTVGFPDSLFGGGRRDDIANVIRGCGADIVGVQECGDVAWLLKELGPGWHGIGKGSSKYASAIVARFPLVPLVSDDFLTAARVAVPAGEVIVVNAHWWPPKNSGAALIRERMNAGTVPADPAEFEKQILAASDASAGPRGYDRTLSVLRPHLEAGARIVLTGDFNESSHLDWTERAAQSGIDHWPGNPTGRLLRFKIAWKGSKLLSEAGLSDAYRVAHADEVAKPGITWTPRYEPSPGRRPYDEQVLERLDRVHFSTSGLKLLDAAVVGEDPATCEQVHQGRWVSDHRAVKATFAMTGTGSDAKIGSKTPSEPAFRIVNPKENPFPKEPRRNLSVNIGGGKGVVIAPHWVLTAAHCISSKRGDTVKMNYMDESGTKVTLTSDKVVRHGSTDFALVRLSEAANGRSPLLLLKDGFPVSKKGQAPYRLKKVAGNGVWEEIPARVSQKSHGTRFYISEDERHGKAGTSGSPWVIHSPLVGDVLVGVTHGTGRVPQVGKVCGWIESTVTTHSADRVLWATPEQTLAILPANQNGNPHTPPDPPISR